MLLATTVQQSVAYVIAALVAVGFVLWLVANVRRAKPEVGAELELAPNRKPYYDDEGMEGTRLDRFLGWGLVSLTIVAVGLPLYWLAEPGRQSGAVANFEETFAHRGENLSLPTAQGGFNCQGCHGGVSGGWVQYNLTLPNGDVKAVAWWAPSLDDVALRMSDDQLKEILTYGRPFSPMPAWGLAGGGSMNEQQIDNLIDWLKSIAISPKEAKARNVELADKELARLRDPEADLAQAESDLATTTDPLATLVLQGRIALDQATIEQAQAATEGAALFNTQCARCHTIGWSYQDPGAPGSGAFGPPLTNVLRQFPELEEHVDFVTSGRKFGERYGAQGKASGRMPYFSQLLTKEQIEALVAYERSLGETQEQAQ
jgi:mono/diheme cytochrome c family protein